MLLQQRKEERKINHFQVCRQAGPPNHSANTYKLADAVQKLALHLSQRASNMSPTASSPTLLWFPPVFVSDEHPGACALFDVLADPALRDCGLCAVSMKAIKTLNLCHDQNRPCIHLFISILLAKLQRSCFRPPSLVFALKTPISMSERAMTQLAMCIQTLIALVCVRQTSSDVPLVFARGSRNMTLVVRMRRRVYEKAAMQQSPGDWSHLFQTRLGS